MPSTSRPVWESRAPVGSSARMTGGSAGQGPGDGHPLLLAAGELDGLVLQLVAQAHLLQGLRARCRRSALGTPAYISGTSTFSSRFSLGSRLYCWKMKPSSSLRIAAS